MSLVNAEYYRADELPMLGFRRIGEGARVHRTAVLVNTQNIEIGAHSRIDPFVVLSATSSIMIGAYVHVSAYASIIGAGDVTVGDFSNLSVGTRVFSSSDDYSGAAMTGPLVGTQFTNVTHAPVTIGRHVILGSGTVVAPGVSIGEGCATGALTFVNSSLEAWNIYAGAPAKIIKVRQRDALDLERQFRVSVSQA